MPYPDDYSPSAGQGPDADGYTAAELLCMRLDRSYCATRAQDHSALPWRLGKVADYVYAREMDAAEISELDALADQVAALVERMENVAGVAA